MLHGVDAAAFKYVELDTAVASDFNAVQVFLLALLVVTTLVMGFYVFMPAVASLSASKEHLSDIVDKLPTRVVGQLRRRFGRLDNLMMHDEFGGMCVCVCVLQQWPHACTSPVLRHQAMKAATHHVHAARESRVTIVLDSWGILTLVPGCRGQESVG